MIFFKIFLHLDFIPSFRALSGQYDPIEIPFSPDFVEISRNIALKYRMRTRQCRVRMRRLFHYSLESNSPYYSL